MKKTNFILLYLLCLIPTYILPYFGSNSILAAAGTLGITLFWTVFHIIFLVIMILLAHKRGKDTTINYLMLFPILAGAFDMVPMLSMIPLVPTIFHLLAIVMGVVKEKQAVIEEAT